MPSRDDQADSAAYLAAFGAAVRRHRERLGLSQERFGFESELDRTYVSGIERGVRNCSTLHLVRVARALRVRVADLFPE